MDQYTILGRIGEGAHGIVFKAKNIEVSILANSVQTQECMLYACAVVGVRVGMKVAVATHQLQGGKIPVALSGTNFCPDN